MVCGNYGIVMVVICDFLEKILLFLKTKCFVIFGKVVIKNTRWLFEDALILKKRTAELLDTRCEPVRTRDGTEDRLLVDRATDDDIK